MLQLEIAYLCMHAVLTIWPSSLPQRAFNLECAMIVSSQCFTFLEVSPSNPSKAFLRLSCLGPQS